MKFLRSIINLALCGLFALPTMSKSSGKKKKQVGETILKQPESYEIAVIKSQKFKEEGDKLFRRKDYEYALLKYHKAITLLHTSDINVVHINVVHLRTKMADCYMQMGISYYLNAILECNLALEVLPNCTKALIKRASCYLGLNRLELALRDLKTVLANEPNNLTALELMERVKQAHETSNGIEHPLVHYIVPRASVNKNEDDSVLEKQPKSEGDPVYAQANNNISENASVLKKQKDERTLCIPDLDHLINKYVGFNCVSVKLYSQARPI